MGSIRAIWIRDDQWWFGGTPDQTLLFSSLQELRLLDQQIQTLTNQYPELQALGAISYEASMLDEGSAPGSGFIYIYYHSAKSVASLESLKQGLPLTSQAAPRLVSGKHRYRQHVEQIHEHLKRGDVYQINYTERFEGQALSNPLERWLSALEKRPAPHACFAQLPDLPGCPIRTLMSFSPERLIQVKGNRVVTEPIKGSTARNDDPEQDHLLGDALLSSEKNRAENLMIVDLLRNDLGKICTTGSVKTEKLFELRKFPTIQHLVSTISGELRHDISPLQALAAVFPGGSITGAPKIKAMEIIGQLESAPRHFYCGSAFSFDAQGDLEANILIRTFQQTEDRLYCHAGGGIVIDSDVEDEFREMHLKIEPLIDALCSGNDQT